MTAQRGLHSEERCENIIEKIGDILESAPAGGSNQQRENAHEERRGVPHGGDDELGGEQLMEAHGQRQREIALVLEHMVAPADGGEHQRRKPQRAKTHHEADDQQHTEQLKKPGGNAAVQEQLRKTHQRRQCQHSKKDRPHDAARCAEFMFDQFAQHLNTSRKSSSTLLPFSSRMVSTLSWSMTCPSRRNTTSSRICSTSAIRCVEMMTAASSL